MSPIEHFPTQFQYSAQIQLDNTTNTMIQTFASSFVVSTATIISASTILSCRSIWSWKVIFSSSSCCVCFLAAQTLHRAVTTVCNRSVTLSFSLLQWWRDKAKSPWRLMFSSSLLQRDCCSSLICGLHAAAFELQGGASDRSVATAPAAIASL